MILRLFFAVYAEMAPAILSAWTKKVRRFKIGRSPAAPETYDIGHAPEQYLPYERRYYAGSWWYRVADDAPWQPCQKERP